MKALIWAAVSTRAQTNDDKFSLPQQEQDGRDMIAREGWELVEVLRVPGHTRSQYMEFHKLAAAANKKGIDAFLKLEEHWTAKDFDVLIIRDGDRLARAQGVMGTIVESIIHTGARIYCFADGWIDSTNYRMWISMVGYRAASDIDKIKKFIDEGANKRAQRGLPVGSGVLWSHKLVRGDNGRALYQIPDPDKQLFFQDAATLLLEGVSWYDMEAELFKRFGHGTPDGKPFPPRKVYHLLYNPSAWGHIARFFRDHRRKSQFKGAWAYDPTAEPPKGVTLFYNVHQPIYEGELAVRVQQEMRRREQAAHGGFQADSTFEFTGLLVCGACGANLLHHWNHRQARPWERWYCFTKHRKHSYATCTQSKGMKHDYVRDFIDAKLREAIEQHSLEAILGLPVQPPENIVSLLNEQIETLEAQAKRLIHKQATAPESLSAMYDEQLQQLGEQLAQVRQRLLTEKKRQVPIEHYEAQVRTLEEIAAMSLETFWQKPRNEINQYLHRLLANRRWLVLDGVIVDQQDALPHRRH